MTVVTRLPLIGLEVECRVERGVIDPEFQVGVSQLVEPETVVAVTRAGAPRVARIAAAVELGVAPNEVARHLVRALGDRVEAGEVVAARRRGLRTLQVTSPLAGRLQSLDERTGTLEVVADAPRRPVPALVAGEVEDLREDAVVIRVVGDLVQGAALLGPECAGSLVVLADRPDRELPVDAFDERCRGAVVVAGLTVSSAVLRRLQEVGAAGVIVGGISVSALEPFIGRLSGDQLSRLVTGSEVLWPFSFGVLVQEGFGRLPLPRPLFAFWQERSGRRVSLLRATSLGLERPACFVSSRGLQGRPLEPVAYTEGTVVAIERPARPGIGVLRSAPFLARSLDGFPFAAVLVEREDGVEVVPTELVVPLGITP